MARGAARRDARMADVRKWSDVIAKWTAEKSRAQSQLTQIRAQAGEAVLENPESGAQMSKTMQRLRDEIEIAENALVAAAPRLEAARAAVLELDAAGYEARAGELRKEYDAHCAQTDALLAQLEQHECRFVPEQELARARGSNFIGGEDSWTVPKSGELYLRVERELTKAAVLRDVAAGVDPANRLGEMADIVDATVLGRDRLEFYPPAVWGPDAVIPAPAFLSRVASARRALAEHDAAVAVDDGPEIQKRQQVIDAINESEVAANEHRRHPLTAEEERRRETRQRWIADREVWRREAPKRRAELAAELEALTGEDHSGGVQGP